MEFIGEVILALAAVIASYFFGSRRGDRQGQEKVIEKLEAYYADTRENAIRGEKVADAIGDRATLERVLSGKSAKSFQGATIPADEDGND